MTAGVPDSVDMPRAAIASVPARLGGLARDVGRLLERAGRALDARDIDAAEPLLVEARSRAPDHPEVLRLWAVACVIEGHADEAIALLRQALDACPDDPLLLNNLGSALKASGDASAAIDVYRRTCAIAPTLAAGWYNLGKTLKVQGETVEANEALERALALAPGHIGARIVHADNLKALGRIGEAEAQYREVARRDETAAHAWWGLANLKTTAFDAADASTLENLFKRATIAERDRPALAFALAKALEDQDRYAEAFAVLHEANALRRRQQPWDAAAFERAVDAIIATFDVMPRNISTDTRGHEVIFIVSLPRSGSTLVEQIIASHPSVEGAGELPDLGAVIAEESARRGLAFPDWVKTTGALDWQRLGERYLERTARWRRTKPRSTDKSLSNGPLIGAAAAMLPGARFVHCRRDPLETILSCYRQWFHQGQAWSYSLDDTVAYWRDHERLMQAWRDRLPDAFYLLDYENLLSETETSVRSLLEFCGLPFDARCLQFHRSERSVRTASAAQVRQPLRRDTSRAAHYGDLLDPLRRLIAGR